MSFRGKLWVMALSGAIAVYAVVGSLPMVGNLLTARAQQVVNDPNAQMKIVASVLDHIQNDYVDQPDMDKVRVGALRGMASGLDPYSNYLTPEQVTEYQSGKAAAKTGIGVEFAQISGYLYALSVVKGGPADKAGLRTGDVIEYVDSKATRDISLYDAKQLVSGDAGTTVALRVLRSGEKPQTIEVVRGTAKAPGVESHVENGKVGVVKVYSLEQGAAADVRSNILSLQKQGIQKIVLDLRGIADGKIDEAATVANLFIKDGTLATIVGKENKIIKTFAADPSKAIFDGGASVLTNLSTSGAAEAVAAAFIAQKRGDVVGERTFGAGTEQAFFPLSRGGGYLLTVAKWASPSGAPFLGEDRNTMGIKPTVEVKRPDTQDPDEVETLLDQNDPNNPNPKPTPSPTPQAKPKTAAVEDVQLKKAVELLSAS